MIVVSANSVSRQSSQRTGSLQLEGEVVRLQSLETSQLNSTQQQVAPSADTAAPIVFCQPGEVNSAANVAHTGTEAQVTRTRRRALLPLGDFFSGSDPGADETDGGRQARYRHHRPAGHPDVAGDVRASGTINEQRIQFRTARCRPEVRAAEWCQWSSANM